MQEPLILLAEDSEDDVMILRRSFKKAGITNPLQVVYDGEEAISYLSGAGNYSDRAEFPIPELILLDLKMPKLDGFDVLRWIRLHRDYFGICVVVLTSSQDIRDVNRACALGANSFLVKPADFNGFVELSNFLNDYWFVLSKTPAVSRAFAWSESRPRTKGVLVRDKSGRYYAGHARWVANRDEAVDFERIELAEALVTAQRLHGVEIVLGYDAPAIELSVPASFANL